MKQTFIALTALDALLLWVLIRTHGYWYLRAAAIVVVLAFNLAVWQARPSFDGYPTAQSVPDEAKLVSCLVDEDGGDIYLWLLPIPKETVSPFDYEGGTEPRAYRLPYTRKMHEACVAADKTRAAGGTDEIVVGRTNGSSQVRLYVLPPQGLPTKEGTP